MTWTLIVAPILSAVIAAVLAYRKGVQDERRTEAHRSALRKEAIRNRTTTSGSIANPDRARITTARVRRNQM